MLCQKDLIFLMLYNANLHDRAVFAMCSLKVSCSSKITPRFLTELDGVIVEVPRSSLFHSHMPVVKANAEAHGAMFTSFFPLICWFPKDRTEKHLITWWCGVSRLPNYVFRVWEGMFIPMTAGFHRLKDSLATVSHVFFSPFHIFSFFLPLLFF